jgi:hypothetical protein
MWKINLSVTYLNLDRQIFYTDHKLCVYIIIRDCKLLQQILYQWWWVCVYIYTHIMKIIIQSARIKQKKDFNDNWEWKRSIKYKRKYKSRSYEKKAHAENIEVVAIRMTSWFVMMNNNYSKRDLCNQLDLFYILIASLLVISTM